MFPLRDNIPARRFAFVNYAMIGVCALVFGAQLLSQQNDELAVVERFGMIPARVLNPDEPIIIRELEHRQTPAGYQLVEHRRQAAESPIPPWLTLLTCIFLHGGWLHFLGNMWFLHIFGDNVEDRLGHLGYLAFYLLTGVAASAFHLATNTTSTLPTVGASGAIAGVMGSYLVLYPHARVLSVIPIFFFIQIVVLPAPLFLGVWFALQFFQGAFTIGDTEAGGVAWWAHIGGFVVGAATAWILKLTGMTSEPVSAVLPHTDHSGTYRLRNF